MIQAYCSNCKKDLGVLPKPVCSKDMICRDCFTEKYLDSLFDTEMVIKLLDEESKRIKNWISPLEAYGFPPRGI